MPIGYSVTLYSVKRYPTGGALRPPACRIGAPNPSAAIIVGMMLAVRDHWWDTTNWGDVFNLLVAVFAALATYGAYRVARTMTAIEVQRRQNELCPRLIVSMASWGPGSDIMRLRLKFMGPPGLDQIDRLTFGIRDDRFGRNLESFAEYQGGSTREEWLAHIWGPYQLRDQFGPGWMAGANPRRGLVFNGILRQGEELVFALDQTHPLPSASGNVVSRDSWVQSVGRLFRFEVTVERDGFEPWRLPGEIDTASLPKAVLLPVDPAASIGA